MTAVSPSAPGAERAPLSSRRKPGRHPDLLPRGVPLDHHQGSQPHRQRDQGRAGRPARLGI